MSMWLQVPPSTDKVEIYTTSALPFITANVVYMGFVCKDHEHDEKYRWDQQIDIVCNMAKDIAHSLGANAILGVRIEHVKDDKAGFRHVFYGTAVKYEK